MSSNQSDRSSYTISAYNIRQDDSCSLTSQLDELRVDQQTLINL